MDIKSLNFELLKAFIGWCYSCGLKPQLVVKYFENIGLDKSYFENDKIVLSIAENSVIDLIMENNFISFKTRFNQMSYDLLIPVEHVLTCYPRENHSVFLPLYFLVSETQQPDSNKTDDTSSLSTKDKPKLSLISKN